MPNDFQFIRVRTDGRTARITLDRPPLNVIHIPMMNELARALYDLTDRCDFIVFEGAGEKGFSTGVEVADHTPDKVAGMLQSFHGIFRQLWKAECLTIAKVHGYCLGGGCELASFCDFVVAAESAMFGQPEIRLGCFPPIAMVTLPLLVGHRAASEFILTGRTFSAAESRQLGLITRVAPDGDLEASVGELLSELNSSSSAVLRLTHRTLWRRAGFDFEKSLAEVEQTYLEDLMQSHDAQEGIRAFIEKRKPVWQGR
ncbi:MAG: enoyl-CoA hydratase/isomerase family protein [Acidobacteria bacterium]|nr:enoyl-CoA hydratase/isomerase family protein [Acidobacteriota bacterium]